MDKDMQKLLPPWRMYCLTAHQKLIAVTDTLTKPLAFIYNKINNTEAFEKAELKHNLEAFRASIINRGL